MQGVLFKWGSSGSKVAFRSPLASPKRHVVLIGGLTDGLLPVPYTQRLAAALEFRGWGLVQTLLTSSYTGYGIASLDQDAEELDELLSFMAREMRCDGVVLAGHSTGCQDIVHYLGRKENRHRALVKGAILQGPASDREYMATLPDTPRWLRLAREMVARGEGSELMPRAANEAAPITAARYLSLGGKGGLDDLFSSDFTNDELAARLDHMAGTPTLVLYSGADEYVPGTIDKAALLNRICKAMGGAEGVLIEGADHALRVGQELAVPEIGSFIDRYFKDS